VFQEGLRCNLTVLVNSKAELFAPWWDTRSLYRTKSVPGSCVSPGCSHTTQALHRTKVRVTAHLQHCHSL